jgi:hypothetical protein
MQDFLSRHLANGFAEFPGLNVTGNIPIKQELLNEILAEMLRSGLNPRSVLEPAPDAASPPKIDASRLLERIKRAEVEAAEGKIIFHFEIGVEEGTSGGTA